MSVDKLIDSAQLESDLTDVADAIRAKTGGTADLQFPADFVSEIGSISGGGEWTSDGLANLSEPSGAITLSVTSIGANAFTGKTALTSISGASVTNIGTSALSYCTNLAKIDFPEVTTFGTTVCQYSTALVDVNLPKLTTAGNSGNYTFRNCSHLVGLVLPSYTGVFGQGFFEGCSALTYIDVLGGSFGSFGGNKANFNLLIVRKTASVASLSSINGFNNTPFANDGTGGTLYVPSALISSYQSATNWSTILGYANNSIEAIEGSQYENYYADGTPIPTT